MLNRCSSLCVTLHISYEVNKLTLHEETTVWQSVVVISSSVSALKKCTVLILARYGMTSKTYKTPRTIAWIPWVDSVSMYTRWKDTQSIQRETLSKITYAYFNCKANLSDGCHVLQKRIAQFGSRSWAGSARLSSSIFIMGDTNSISTFPGDAYSLLCYKSCPVWSEFHLHVQIISHGSLESVPRMTPGIVLLIASLQLVVRHMQVVWKSN